MARRDLRSPVRFVATRGLRQRPVDPHAGAGRARLGSRELPVTFTDRVGIVNDVGQELGGMGVIEDVPIANPPGRPDKVRVAWTGGACDRSVAMELRADGPGFVLAMVTTVAPGRLRRDRHRPRDDDHVHPPCERRIGLLVAVQVELTSGIVGWTAHPRTARLDGPIGAAHSLRTPAAPAEDRSARFHEGPDDRDRTRPAPTPSRRTGRRPATQRDATIAVRNLWKVFGPAERRTIEAVQEMERKGTRR